MTTLIWHRKGLLSFRDLACVSQLSLHRSLICRRQILLCPSKLSLKGYRCMVRPLSSLYLRRSSFFTRVGSCSSMTSLLSIKDQVRSCLTMTKRTRSLRIHTVHKQQPAQGKLTMRQCARSSLMRVKKCLTDTYRKQTQTVLPFR